MAVNNYECHVEWQHFLRHGKYDFHIKHRHMALVTNPNYPNSLIMGTAAGRIHVIGKTKIVTFEWMRVALSREIPEEIDRIYDGVWLYLPVEEGNKYRLFVG